MRQCQVYISVSILGLLAGCGAGMIALSAQPATAIDQFELPELQRDKSLMEPSIELAPPLEEETLDNSVLEPMQVDSEQPELEETAKEDDKKEGDKNKVAEEDVVTPGTPALDVACLGGVCQPAAIAV